MQCVPHRLHVALLAAKDAFTKTKKRGGRIKMKDVLIRRKKVVKKIHADFCHLNAIHKRIVEPECNIQKLNDRL